MQQYPTYDQSLQQYPQQYPQPYSQQYPQPYPQPSMGIAPMGIAPMGIAPMGIAPSGLFTAPWWYYALVVATIVFILYCIAPEDTKTKKPSAPSKSTFTNKKTNNKRYYSEY